MNAVLDALLSLQGPAVLATVVRVEGSAYRREGAKMLIPADGPAVGMLSGGCLEDDVREQAQSTFQTGLAQLLSYDMRSPDDSLWGLNMGCNGLVEVLVERVGPLHRAAAAEVAAGRRCTAPVVITVGPHLGHRVLVREDGTVLGDEGQDLLAAAGEAAGRQQSVTVGDVEVYVEQIMPAPVLWVIGAGSDAPPLVQAAAAAGWQVRVVDRRAKYADPSRFPAAAEVLRVEPAELAQRVGPGAFVIFMHHNFDHDRDYLTALLATDARYLGVLGPLKRTGQLLGRDDLPAAVYAPIGLDIGGEGPEAIAVAMVAEIQAVRHGRRGGHLRGSGDPLH